MYIALCADEHSHPIYSVLFSVNYFPQNLMLKCLHFSPNAGSLYGD